MTLAIVLRVIHVTLGVFWAGAVFYLTLFLMPSAAAAGPAGGAVMQELARRRQLTWIPLAALFTILSGLWLMWIVSGGFSPAWMGSPRGILYSTGMLTSIVAFAIGLGVLRPTSMRMLATGPQLQGMADGREKEAVMATMAALRGRSRTASLWIAALLLVAVLTMAVGRYV